MNTPVLIVGAGPVGLTLACELTRYQVPVRIVDKAPQRTDKSKAIVLWSRTLELLDRGDQGVRAFRRGGLQGRRRQYRRAGRPRDRPRQNGFGGEPVSIRADAAAIRHRAPARGKASAPGRLGRAQHGGHGAHDRGRRRARRRFVARTAAKRRVHADWLAGCDGAHSIVRHTLAAPFSGETMGSDWILARRPYEGISVSRYRGRRLLGARGRASDLPDLAGALSHHRQCPAERRRPSSRSDARRGSGDRRAAGAEGRAACSIRSGCRASESIRARSQAIAQGAPSLPGTRRMFIAQPAARA